MGRSLALPSLATMLLAGCSLIFNPSNLDPPPIDSPPPPDAAPPVDADPSMLALTGVQPTVILEGQGEGGSRRAIVVVAGRNIADDATLTVTGGDLTPGVVTRASDHAWIAIELTAPVDGTVDSGDVPLTITVAQADGRGGTLTRTIPDEDLTEGLVLRHLPELVPSAATLARAAVAPLYSRIALPDAAPPASITLTGTDRMELRAVASVVLPALIADGASGSGTTGGGARLGGCAGGAAGAPGGCAAGGGGAGTGNTAAGGGGGGGGFGTDGTSGAGNLAGGAGTGTGDALLIIYPGTGAASNRPSGGGGGGAPALLGNGGGGGGGGGAIEITAGGDVTIGTVSIRGGVGASSGGGSGVVAGGGGGAGGSLMVRSGGTLTTGMIEAKGGAGGTANSNGGAGGDGRVRWDAPGGQAPASDVAPHRGPSFATSTPLVVRAAEANVMLTGEPNAPFSFYTVHDGIDQDGASHTFGAAGTFTITPQLSPGLNQVCVLLAGGVRRSHEADKCIEVAFLP